MFVTPAMPRTVNAWPRAYSPENVLAILRARRRGATVSLNHLKLKDSSVEHHALVMEYGLVWCSTIGPYSIVGRFASLFNTDVGPFCGIAEKVTIGASPHWPQLPTSHVFPVNHEFGFCDGAWPRVGRTAVGADAWIGASATVRAGVTIGPGAVVGAGAVVTHDVAPYEVVVGVPARRVRFRFPEPMVEQLLELRWWDWPPLVIKHNLALFRRPLTQAVLDQMQAVAAGISAAGVPVAAR
ncbi:DapH/DapD/GlmU-related protein [Dactylosporangium sp. CS-047395]|uniref:DapH/DapD/GlmU-related protein n=1 Tax=Dactylosporangium sp. CS-047395 TaxID=3239936 RepID=UPI003D94DD3A